MRGGVDACLTVTLVDGLVLARSAFHHSVNYRSVMIFGTATEVTDPDRKMSALIAFMERVAPNRWGEIRGPDPQEFKATTVLSLPLEEVSAKVRTGPPKDDDEDYLLPVWAGVVPLEMVAGSPVPDPLMPEGTPIPAYAAATPVV